MKESMLDKLDQTQALVKTYRDDTIMDYVVCPAKAFITSRTREVPARQKLRDRLPKGMSEIALTMLGGSHPKHPEQLAEDVTNRVFEGVNNEHHDKDFNAIKQMYLNFINMIPLRDLKIDGLARHIEVTYMGTVVQSQVDLVILDTKSGRKLPSVVDFSSTKYEPGYNPIVYRCQMVNDFMQVQNTNTDIMVLSISTGQVWPFPKIGYGPLLHASICEMITAMNADLYPVRFGWWCAGCYWRGICHRMLEVRV